MYDFWFSAEHAQHYSKMSALGDLIYNRHFTASDRILRYGDGREVIAGKTLSVDGEPELCTRGLHACKNILDACGYAPGPYIWWVELSGKVIHDGDKSVGTRRKAVWGYDATEVLREFARVVALEAVEKYWDASKFGPFPEVAIQYLKTGDESLRSAAWSAAVVCGGCGAVCGVCGVVCGVCGAVCGVVCGGMRRTAARSAASAARYAADRRGLRGCGGCGAVRKRKTLGQDAPGRSAQDQENKHKVQRNGAERD